MNQEIRSLLTEIEQMMQEFDEISWAKAFARLATEYEEDSEIASRKIIALYGGMGSFNDIVFFRGGKVVAEENERLDSLRKRLYELCRRN